MPPAEIALTLEAYMIDNDEIEGAARDLGGKVQDAVGGLTGDETTQIKGKVNQAAGKAQQTFGSAKDEVRDVVTNNPLMALAIFGSVCLAVGFLSRR
jgi:uncharacterized protein YjbJ (UPF0337 family)